MEVVVILVFYFGPAIIAMMRGHHNQNAIFVLNLVLGWTLIGWLIALVWSFTSPTPQRRYR